MNNPLEHEERNGGKLKVIMMEGLVPQWMVIAWVFVISSKFFMFDYLITITCISSGLVSAPALMTD